jgi:hypothetical protein
MKCLFSQRLKSLNKKKYEISSQLVSEFNQAKRILILAGT